jgi:hypothetical protein
MIIDRNALSLHSIGDFCPIEHLGQHRQIFQDFLDSSDSLALNGQRYAIAALACLKIIFRHYQAPVSRFAWVTQHSRALRMEMKHPSQWHHADLPAEMDWNRSINFYWYLRTSLPTRTPWGTSQALPDINQIRYQFEGQKRGQYSRSHHLRILLQKSACSDDLLNFAHRRVFRFGYLHRNHPTYIRKAIFALAKYIQQVTGGTAEVRACESIWRHDRWFTEV